ncbi:MAG: MXAN_2562 family outer membrane beta-barrel protein [Myxococcaceae bacterium]
MAVRGALWAGAVAVAALLAAPAAHAQVSYNESPRTGALRLNLGGYRPEIGRTAGFGDKDPYQSRFGASSMLLFAIDYDRFLWKGFGTFGVGLSAGYAEKYGKSVELKGGQPPPDPTTGEQAPLDRGGETSVPTALHVIPIRLMAVYNFDYLPYELKIPLVPYVRAGIAFIPWWATKGGEVERVNKVPQQGFTYGLAGAAGLAFQLDVLGPRMARNLDSDFGINHIYLFAEYNLLQANGFGTKLDLSDDYFMFGMSFEF